jgi:hypothetical protein
MASSALWCQHMKEWTQKKQSSPATRHDGAWGERRYSSYSFLTSALDGGEWSASRPGRALTRGKGPGERTPGTGGWVGLKAGLDTEARGKILCPCRGSNPACPVVQSVVRHYTAWATPAPHEGELGFSCIYFYTHYKATVDITATSVSLWYDKKTFLFIYIYQ